MSDSKRLDLLAQAYDDQVYAVRKAVENFGMAYWDALPNYRDTAMEDLLGAIVPRLKAGQIRIGELTKAYIEAVADEGGWLDNTPPVDIEEITSQRGVSALEVYQRPIVTVRSKLAEGKNLQEAAEAGKLRLLQLIGGDMQLAKRAQARSSMSAAGMKAYRRKLTGRENCALCVVASTQRYWVNDLMPIHPGCDCNIEPLPDHLAHKQVIDEEILERVHEAIEQEIGISDRGAREPDYRDFIMTTEHGEYGPTLAWKETRDERRAQITQAKKKSMILDSRPSPKAVHITLSDIESRRVTNGVLKEGIRPYPSLKEVPRHVPSHISMEQQKVNVHRGKKIPLSSQEIYGLPEQPYDVNCARCTTALELRVRGYDVVAGAGNWEILGNWPEYLAQSWIRPDGTHPEWVWGLGNRELVTHLFETEPDGARGFMFVEWEGVDSTHIFNWERSPGKLRFYDSQVINALPENERHRQVNWAQIENDAEEGMSMYIRVDDCTPTDRVLNMVSVEVT